VATHVFVESSWVIGTCAPSHFRSLDAVNLSTEAKNGSLTVYVPAVCLGEGRNVIRKKFQPRHQLAPIRTYIRWAKDQAKLDSAAAEAVRKALEQYEQFVSAELDNLDSTIAELMKMAGVQVFPLSQEMLERALSLSVENLDLHPFDNAILAAVLVRSKEIIAQDAKHEIFFCTLDGDLQPWDKNGSIKPLLKRLYDEAHILVWGNFRMSSHGRPADSP
jgi:PIN domain nuclease of toxin-antitoxin system